MWEEGKKLHILSKSIFYCKRKDRIEKCEVDSFGEAEIWRKVQKRWRWRRRRY